MLARYFLSSVPKKSRGKFCNVLKPNHYTKMKGSISVNGLLLIFLWMTFCWFALVALELSTLKSIKTQGTPVTCKYFKYITMDN